MIRIAAVDDEMHALENFERIVGENKDLILCGLFNNGKELLDYLKEQPLDAVFLDIEMPDIDGLMLTEQILNLDKNIAIIFMTAFNQYAVEAFELNALDYIIKPLSEKRLIKTITRLLKTKSADGITEKPHIQCFGGFDVFLNGEALSWKNSKAKEVLAYLVHKKGAPVDWEKIADAVWPDYGPEKAHANFHATTYLLRKRLVEAGISCILESNRGNYRIRRDKISCDLYQFEGLMQKYADGERTDAALHKAALLYQGGYMEENGYGWAYPRAAELERMYRRFLGQKAKE